MERLILLSRSFSYCMHRLRYVLLQRGLLLLTRYAEWESFQNLIPARHAFLYLIFRYLTEFMVRYRWSSLEDLRAELSRLRHNRQHKEFRRSIHAAWRSAWRGLLLLILVFLIGCGLATRFLAEPLSPILILILMLGVIGVFCEWLLKTLQSFLFSVSRTRRPFWSLSGLDLLHAILLLTVAQKYGMPGIAFVFFVNTALRISLSTHFTLKTCAIAGIPSLGIPGNLFRGFRIPSRRELAFSLKSGLTLPLIELPFFFSILFYHLALTQWDVDEEYQALAFILSPLYLSASSIAYLYYVDFLKYKHRVFQRVYRMLSSDALRALFSYGLFITLLSWLAARFTDPGILDPADLLIPLMIFLSWGIYFIGTLCAFIRGARWSLLALGLLALISLGVSWDLPSLIAFSLAGPALLGGIALWISSGLEKLQGSQWVSKELIPEHSGIQGVELTRGVLGFSLSNSAEALFSALPAGSLVGLENRRHMIWTTPDQSRLHPRDLLEIFGVYWEKELHLRGKSIDHPLPAGALRWDLGSPLPSTLGPMDSRSLQRLFSAMKQKARGRNHSGRFVPIGFRPIFKDGVWVGGYVWRKFPQVSYR